MKSVLALVSLAVGAVSAQGGSEEFNASALTLREVGARNTLDWRVWLEKDGNPASFWHDVPIYPDESEKNIINMVIEIPRWTNAKIEIKRSEPLNPIFHDDKKDQPRYVVNVWPHKSYPFSYGSIPQTWEDSTVEHEFTGYIGDNDPMDIFDISSLEPPHVGQVKQVKILGGLAMIDDNTTDWKVIAVDTRDPLSKVVETVDDIEKYRPGMKKSFYDWFTYYKVVKGSGLNTIIGNEFQNATTMMSYIEESHEFWLNLTKGVTQKDKISLNQTTMPTFCNTYTAPEDATEKFDIPAESDIQPAAEIPNKYKYWYYLDEEFNVITVPGETIDVV